MPPWTPRGSPGIPLEFQRKGCVCVVFQCVHLRKLLRGQGVDLVILGMSWEQNEIRDPEEVVTMGPPNLESMYP